MKNKKIVIIVSGLVLFVAAFLIVLLVLEKNKKQEQYRKGSTVNDIDININTDDGDKKIDWSKYKSEDVDVSNVKDITTGGIYTLSGSIKNGMVKVDTEDNVKLILDNVDIKNNNGPAIMVLKAENVVIEVKEGTINNLEDSASYNGYDEDVKGVIYSKSDLIFEGNGTLNIKANYKDGIVSKDDLKIVNGVYNIDANDDGIRGKDSLYILDGKFDIVSNGDGIKSTNDSNKEKGFILIEKGEFNIESGLDAIQAETKILIKDGTFNIKTDEGSSNSSKDNDKWGQFGKPGMNGRFPMEPRDMAYVTTSQEESSGSDSAKGIKSGDNLVIEGGKFTFDTADDAIHSNNYVGIKNGEFKISSGDDGIHGDTELIIDGGNIDITKSYEGVESAKITINGGNIKLVASDDGINVAGGADSSSMGRPGANNYNSESKNILIINDGNILVDAVGDGIDINGSGYIYGGDIVVKGPQDNGNGALDYDGELIVNGGNLVAGGSSGMFQGVSQDSKQYSVSIGFNSTISGEVTIEDSKGNKVISYSSDKNFSAMAISSDKLKKNQTYTIKVNGKQYEKFKISSIVTTVGDIKSMGGGPMGGGHGGRPDGAQTDGKPNKNYDRK